MLALMTAPDLSAPAPEPELVPPGSAPGRYRTDVLLMIASKGSTLALNLAASVIVARELGVEGRGAFAVAISLSLTLIQVGTLGLTTANPYFTAKYPERVGQLVTNSFWIAGFLGALLIPTGILLDHLAPGATQGLGPGELALALVTIPIALAGLFLHSVLLGEGRTGAYNLVDIGLGVLSLCALIVGFFVFDMQVFGALFVMLGGYLGGALTWYLLLRRHRPSLVRFDSRLARDTVSYGARIYMSTLLGFLVVRSDMFLVNGYLGNDQAGLYSVAVAVADAVYIVPLAIAINLFPRIARGAGHETSAQVFRVVSVLYCALCAASVVLAVPTVHYLYGPDFDASVALYALLAPGIYFYGMVNVLSHHFAGVGYPLRAAMLFVPAVLLNIAINLVFLDRYGTEVASISSTISYGLLLVLHVRLFASESGTSWTTLLPRPRETIDVVRGALTRGTSQA
jgi:O-antigen/teichoic acid export membrane protein